MASYAKFGVHNAHVSCRFHLSYSYRISSEIRSPNLKRYTRSATAECIRTVVLKMLQIPSGIWKPLTKPASASCRSRALHPHRISNRVDLKRDSGKC